MEIAYHRIVGNLMAMEELEVAPLLNADVNLLVLVWYPFSIDPQIYYVHMY